MTPFIAIWAGMALAVLILAAWRQLIDLHEDDSIHLGEQQSAMVNDQAMLARKLTSVDRWGRLLIIATIVYGVALAGFYLYQQWVQSGKLPGS
jgi:hypothetical protein